MTLIILFVIGSSVGFLSSFFGVGGGLVLVPALYGLFPSMPASMVIGTSLLVTLLNAARNSRAFILQNKKPNFQFIIPIIICSVISSFITRQLIKGLSSQELKKIFIFFLIAVVVKLLMPKSKTSNTTDWTPKKSWLKGGFLGLCLGGVSVALGVGGGVIAIPLFISFFSMPLLWVPIYSNVVMLASSGVATVLYLLTPSHFDGFYGNISSIGSVHFLAASLLFFGGSLTYKKGITLGLKVSDKLKKRSFALLLVIMIIKMSIGVYSK